MTATATHASQIRPHRWPTQRGLWVGVALALVPAWVVTFPLAERVDRLIPLVGFVALLRMPRRAPLVIVSTIALAVWSVDYFPQIAGFDLRWGAGLALATWAFAWSIILPRPRWAAVWVLAMGPLLMQSYRVNPFVYWQFLFVGLMALVAVFAVARRSLLALPVAAVSWGLTLMALGPNNGLRYGIYAATTLVSAGAVWSVSLSVVQPRPGRASIARPARLALVPLAAASVLMLATDMIVIPFALSLGACAVVAAVLVVRPLRRPVTALTDVGESVVRRAVGAVWRPEPLRAAATSARARAARLAAVPGAVGRWFAVSSAAAPAAADRETGPEGPRPRGVAVVRRTVLDYWFPVVAWVVFAYTLTRVQMFSSLVAHHRNLSLFRWWPNPFDASGRNGWGTGDNLRIATSGYLLSDHLEAVFPAFPLLTRALAHWVGGVERAQTLLPSIAGLLSSVACWTWMKAVHVTERHRRWALVLFLVYPYSFILAGTAYNDVLLMPLVLWSLALVERRRPVLAGLVGALATFSRPNALPLVPALLVIDLVRSGALVEPEGLGWAAGGRWRAAVGYVRGIRFDRTRWSLRHAGVLLSLAGVGAYAGWLVHHASDPFYFLTVQEHYGHRPLMSLATWLKVEFVNRPRAFVDNGYEAANHALSFVVLVGAMAAVPAVRRRFGLGYVILLLGLWLISWSGPNGFAPAGRYLLPVAPVLAVVAAERIASRRRILAPALVASFACTVALAVAFGVSGLWLEW